MEPVVDHPTAAEARQFATSFLSFLRWVHDQDDDEPNNEVATLVTDFLGAGAAQQSVVSRGFNPFEHVNLQTALDAWTDRPGREVVVQGITMPPHFGDLELQQLLTGDGLPPLRLSAPALVDLPNGPASTLACLRLALLLVTDAAGRYVLMVTGPSEHSGLRIETAGLPVTAAQSLLQELDELRSALNVYRGHLLDVVPSAMGGVALNFAALPATPREDVVLPESVLARVERHALGVAAHRQALLDAGQHLKRGLLLFGPPGTGKTHTTRYLVAQMAGYTRLLMAGRALHTVSSVAELARELQPAVIVLEDVDLVAEDRSFGNGDSSVLFDLLDAMDGAAADADLLFLLTTNRADLLEAALAARPGRVDVAVEIALPDADSRRRLFELYSRKVAITLTDAELAEVVERTEGVTASFLKELVRRSALEALHDRGTLREVTAEHTGRALDDLLDSAQEVTRTLLGVGVDPLDLPPGGGGGLGPRPAVVGHRRRARGHGWTMYGPG